MNPRSIRLSRITMQDLNRVVRLGGGHFGRAYMEDDEDEEDSEGGEDDDDNDEEMHYS
jgi:hypothetical protein